MTQTEKNAPQRHQPPRKIGATASCGWRDRVDEWKVLVYMAGTRRWLFWVGKARQIDKDKDKDKGPTPTNERIINENEDIQHK